MAYTEYPKSDGCLFPNNDKQKETHPDHRGHIDITAEQINMLIAMLNAGQVPKLQVAMWNRVSRANAPYMFLSVEAYYDPNRVQQQGAAQPAAVAPQAAQAQYPQYPEQPPGTVAVPAPAAPQYPQQPVPAPLVVPQGGAPVSPYPPQTTAAPLPPQQTAAVPAPIPQTTAPMPGQPGPGPGPMAEDDIPF